MNSFRQWVADRKVVLFLIAAGIGLQVLATALLSVANYHAFIQHDENALVRALVLYMGSWILSLGVFIETSAGSKFLKRIEDWAAPIAFGYTFSAIMFTVGLWYSNKLAIAFLHAIA